MRAWSAQVNGEAESNALPKTYHNVLHDWYHTPAVVVAVHETSWAGSEGPWFCSESGSLSYL